MFNRKSIYALNKKDPNAIVYTDADGNLIRLTCDDFACAAEFRRWKDWSDSDLRKEENADHKQSDNSISLEVLSEEATAVISIEDEYMEQISADEAAVTGATSQTRSQQPSYRDSAQAVVEVLCRRQASPPYCERRMRISECGLEVYSGRKRKNV